MSELDNKSPRQAAKFSLFAPLVLGLVNGTMAHSIDQHASSHKIMGIIGLLIILLAVILSIYALFSTRKYGKKGILGYAIAGFILNSFIISSAVFAYQSLARQMEKRINYEMNKIVGEIQRNAPFQFDKGIKLVKASITQPRELTITFTLDQKVADLDQEKWKSSFVPVIQKRLEKTPFYNFLHNGVDVNFCYSDCDGEHFVTLPFKADDYQRQ